LSILKAPNPDPRLAIWAFAAKALAPGDLLLRRGRKKKARMTARLIKVITATHLRLGCIAGDMSSLGPGCSFIGK
jgi:hypothetical protein